MQETTSENAVDISLIFLFASLAGIISAFSGYHAIPVPFDLSWQFSPIGLLQGVSHENRALESVAYFEGRFSSSFDYLLVFLKTCLLELPAYWLCFRSLPISKIFLVLIFANLATHPIVFFVIPLFFETYLNSALVSEAFAAAGEFLLAFFILRRIQPAGNRSSRTAAMRALLIVAANLFSWEVGMFI